MAIRIIEGVPGSGKTYYAVKHLVDTYYQQNDAGFFVKKKEIKLVTNIDSLQLPHDSLVEWINKAGGANKLFSKTFQQKIFEKHGPIVYVIDEAQMIFDRKFYDRDVFSWFEYHRHFGQDIYLVTQAAHKLPRDVTSLVEYIIVALPRSRSITGKEFRYNQVSGGDILHRQVLKSDKKIFALYSSASSQEQEKIKNPFIRTASIVLACCVVAGYFAISYITDSWATTSFSSSVTLADPVGMIDQAAPGVPLFRQNQEEIGQEESSFLPDIPIPHRLNTVTIVKRDGSELTRIYFKGWKYTLGTFPYELRKERTAYFAMIPAADYQKLFPTEEEPEEAPLSKGETPSVFRIGG